MREPMVIRMGADKSRRRADGDRADLARLRLLWNPTA
jgi:hypothetical protein